MASQDYMDKMQLRQNYRNLWHTDLMGTIQADTPCILALSLCIYICICLCSLLKVDTDVYAFNWLMFWAFFCRLLFCVVVVSDVVLLILNFCG